MPDAVPSPAAPVSHAFKEWSAIVNALGAGAQSLILRKGGIAEGRGGFDPARADRFWLFPTQFHAQREKLKPAAAPFFDAGPSWPPPAFQFYAELVAYRFVTDRAALAALTDQHLWTEATVQERFEWAQPPGLHLLLVRVYRLATPLPVPAETDLGGCKSWIEVPLPPPPAEHAAEPVLSDAAHAAAHRATGF